MALISKYLCWVLPPLNYAPMFTFLFLSMALWFPPDQAGNPSAATLKITAQEEKSVSLHWPRDLTGDFLRPPFCDWVMTMSHTWNRKLCFLSLRKYERSLCKTKTTWNIFLLMLLLINIHTQHERNTRTFSCLVSVAHKMQKLMKKATWQSCWTSQQVFRKGRVVKSGWEENILCGSTASCSAQNKERKWAKCALLHATDGLYFTSLFLLSRLQIIWVYPVS